MYLNHELCLNGLSLPHVWSDTEWILLTIKNEFFCLCFEHRRWGRALWNEHNGDNEAGDNEHNQHLQGQDSVDYLIADQ